jgi:hypothetical protein
MAEIDYLHVCDYAFSMEGGKPCIIGIFDAIHSPSFPAIHPHMAIALRIRGRAHEVVPVKIELGRPNGDVLATVQGEFTAGADGSAFLQMNMVSVQFPEPGRYTFRVSSQGRMLTSHTLQLQHVQASGQSGPPNAPAKVH